MKITLNMVRQPDFLNVSPNEVGNSWTSRVNYWLPKTDSAPCSSFC